MKKLSLELVEQKVDEYLKDKETFEAYSLVYENSDYIRDRVKQYEESNKYKKDEIIFKLINERLKTNYYLYTKNRKSGFIDYNKYEDEFKIVFEDSEELKSAVVSNIEQLIENKTLQEQEEILNELLDNTSEVFSEYFLESNIQSIKDRFSIELKNTNNEKIYINKDGLLELNFTAIYTHYECVDANDFFSYGDFSDDEINEILAKADDLYEEEVINSNEEAAVFDYYYNEMDIDRENTSLCDDFIWAKNHNIDDKIIDELLSDLKNKIEITLNENSLEEIEQAKDFIVLQGGETLYDYFIQEIKQA